MKNVYNAILFCFLTKGIFAQLTTVTFNTTTSTNPYQTFIIPCGVNSITIEAIGGSGGGKMIGSGTITNFGRATKMTGTFAVAPGDIIKVRPASHGYSTVNDGGGGGGASWAINATTGQVLIVAGGGGGASVIGGTTWLAGGNATITNSGTSGGLGYMLGSGGGGGGWSTDGGPSLPLGGLSYMSGGLGGGGSSSGAGGFGGGGGGGLNFGHGGGGGGYSGGAAGYTNNSSVEIPSEGGGSYNSGTNQNNLVNSLGPFSNWGYNGKIIISYSDPLSKPIILGQNSICAGETTTLSIQNPTIGYAYYWSNGLTGTSININQVGTYSVYAVSSCGTSQVSDVFNLVVNTPPLAEASTASPTSICEGSSILLTANTGVNLTYQWLYNDINISLATNSSYSAILSGSYKVIVSNGICSDTSNAISVMVNPIPLINITSDNQTNYCGTSIVQNTLTSNQSQSYLWNTGETSQSIFVSQQGVYIVTVEDMNGCQNTDSIQITVNPLPNVFAGNNQTICQGDNITLTASGATTYTWNNGVTNNVAFSPSISNTYVVVGTDANGCQDSDSVNITVNQNTFSTITQTANNTYNLNGQTYTQSGTYTQVIPSANGCDSTITLNLTINNVGLNELFNSTIFIYPNPAINEITITYSGHIQKVEIMDAKGAIVYSSIENKKDIVLPSTMQTGYYLVLVHTAEGVFRKELVVSK